MCVATRGLTTREQGCALAGVDDDDLQPPELAAQDA